ncbi:MAG: primosomal protein N' [Traorella sp.]
MNLVYCYIEFDSSTLDQTYTYCFKNEDIKPGKRVLVDFNGYTRVGFVDHVELDSTKSFPYEIKPILEVIDEQPILNEEMLELGKWLSKTTISTVISAYQAMVPSQLKPKSSYASKKIVMENWVRPLPLMEMELTARQKEVYDILVANKEMKMHEWRKVSTVTKVLEGKGLVEVFQKEKKTHEPIIEKKPCKIVLNDEQKKAVERILTSSSEVICLKGVTGSGKTEVFLHVAQKVLEKGKQVLFLVPEISLTPMMVERVKERFGNDVAIYHSGLTTQQKYEQYQSVKNKEKKIVVGTRSAIFMPFDSIGLIILDEEHDLSYKQESGCRYHARDVAIYRGKKHHALVVLASATPSLDTMARAIKNVYELVEIKKRVNQNLPQVKLINMNEVIRKKQSYILSNELIEAMQETLQKKQQILLLLNRRGYQPILRCKECGKILMCPHCDKPLVYHKDTNTLHCHLCGIKLRKTNECPTCHGKLMGGGFGTQMLEEKLFELFPNARIIRMDADTTSRKDAHQKLLTSFKQHEADILLGTQMIAKGLDFENVTLVGIVTGDAMLARSDYRSSELTFDLLTQASGRSGRGNLPGKVLIQVYDSEHYAIQCALSQDYYRFFKNEMQYRHLASYPPYTYLCTLTFSHKNQELALNEANEIMNELMKYEFKVLGVSELLKIMDKKRYRICVKSKSQQKLQDVIYDIYQKHRLSKSKVNLEIDMNPLTMDD